MVSYAGYQLVRELRRSPVGFDALAHRSDAPTREFLVEVRLPDPIAAGGDERLGIEQFLRQARVQQSIGSDAWVRVLEVGQGEDEGYAVKDYYARSVRTLIEAKARLEPAQTRLLMLGILDGLIALRDRCGGRAHGELDAARVLIDESPGPGRWRGLLNAPADDADGRVRGKVARLDDLRGLARIIIGLVDLRVPSSLPGSVGPNERWKQAFGPQVEAWVEVVNALLDISLDPDALPLEEVRRRIEVIVAPVRRSKRGLVIAGLVGLAVLGGGGYLGVRMLGGGQKAAVVHYDFTPLHWVEFNIDFQFKDLLTAENWSPPPGVGAESAWEKWFASLGAAVAQKPDTSERPSYIADTPELLARLINPAGSQEVEAAERDQQKAGKAAASYAAWKRGVLDVLVQAPGKQSLEEVGAWLGENPLGEALTRQASAWEEWTSPWTTPEGLEGQIDSSAFKPEATARAERVKAFVDRVRLAAAAAEVNEQIRKLEEPLSRIVQAGEANDDAVLREAGAIVRRFVVRDDKRDVRAALSGMGERLSTQVSDVVSAIAATLDGVYAQTHKPSLRQALADVNTQDGTLESLRRWHEVVSGKTLVELTGPGDPLSAWRGGGQPPKRAGFPAQIAQLEQLLRQDGVTSEQRAAVAEEMQRAKKGMDEADDLVRAALDLAPIAANQQRLREAADAAKQRVDEASSLMALRIDDLSVTRDKLKTLFAQARKFGDEQVDARFDEIRAQFFARLDSTPVEALPKLNESYKQVQARMEEIKRRHDVRLETGAWAGKLAIEAVETSFAQLRSKRLTLALVAVSIDAVAPAPSNEETDPVLTQVRVLLEEAIGRVGDLSNRLDGWQEPEAMREELALVSGFSLAGVPGLEAADAQTLASAFGSASADLLARVRAAGLVSGTPDELVGIVRQGLSNKPEQRVAAYRALSRSEAWPRTTDDLNNEVAARESLLEAIRSAGVSVPELVAEIERTSAQRWHAALAGSSDEARFSAVMGLRDRFKDADQLLTDADRRNIRLLELKAALSRVDASNKEQADAQVRQVVQAWVREAGGLFDGQAAWVSGLEAALEENAKGAAGGMFEADSAGPAAVGAGVFKGADEEFSYLDYTIAGIDVRLLRVGELESDAANEAGQTFVWYLQTEEVSLELFSAVARERSREEQWRALARASETGPSVWQRRGPRGFAVARAWLEANPDISSSASPLFAQGDPADRYLLAQREQNPSPGMPMQQISYNVAKEFAEEVGLRLPTLAVWRSAAGAVLGGLNANAAQAAGLNLRDATWGQQADYDRQNNFLQGMAGWRSDWFGRNPATDYFEQRWGDLNDGYLYFAPTNRASASGPFADLVGNVAEYVTAGDAGGAVYVVGGSAMSPPPTGGGDLEVRARPRDLRDGYADVGFRLAMRVPKDAFITTALQRVNRHLRSAPFTWAGGNP
ncbi:MAG: hypothetical protein KJZ65_09515 [Phycisphaerales bacterium]|nr:hypothetical protein [Phycisphaerales bacterium]